MMNIPSFAYSIVEHFLPKTTARKVGYAILSGILLGCAFPPFNFGYLGYIALMPLIFLIEQSLREEKPRLVSYLYISYFIYQGIANWWVGSWQKESDPFLMIAGIALQIGHPFFLMLPCLAYFYVRKHINHSLVIFAFPFFYVAYEWLHSLTDASYPWLSIGYMNVNIPVIAQFADIFGIWGLSFVIVLIQSILFWMLTTDSKRQSYFGMIALIIVTSSVLIYGIIRLDEIQKVMFEAKTIQVGIVQPNINPWNKWSSEARDQILTHKSTIEDSKLSNPDIWIWSETAIPFMNIELNIRKDFSYFRQIIGSVPVLTGFAQLELVQNPEKEPLAKPFRLIPGAHYIAYNAAALVQEQSVQIHQKMKLTPFGEGVPFSQDIPFLGEILQWGVGISGWKKGAIQQPLLLKKNDQTIASIGTVICIESIYPGFVRTYSNSGATMLAVITNDAWFDNTPGPMQHFAISQMRAIETRRAIARCGNTGISGIISPDGSVSTIAPPQTRIALSGMVPQMNIQSIYAQIGDVLPIICTIFSSIMIFQAGYQGAIKRRNQ
jgi:apolipoprotein N-acyltransferase